MDSYQIIPIEEGFEVRVLPRNHSLEISPETRASVEKLWEMACRNESGSQMFNGQIFSAMALEDKRLLGAFVEYKLFVAQLHDSVLASALPIEPVAVSGMTRSGGDFLIGKRSSLVTKYKGLWELMPSGGIDPDAVKEDMVDISGLIQRELEEEAGISGSKILSVNPFQLIRNRYLPHIEICVAVELDRGCRLDLVAPATWEYESCQWISPKELQKMINSHRKIFVPASILLFEQLRQNGICDS